MPIQNSILNNFAWLNFHILISINKTIMVKDTREM